MSSTEFLRRAKEIAKRDKETFDQLLEFEKTRRIQSKERLNFTIDRSTASQFRRLCQQKGYNMSAKVEEALKNLVKEEGSGYRK